MDITSFSLLSLQCLAQTSLPIHSFVLLKLELERKRLQVRGGGGQWWLFILILLFWVIGDYRYCTEPFANEGKVQSLLEASPCQQSWRDLVFEWYLICCRSFYVYWTSGGRFFPVYGLHWTHPGKAFWVSMFKVSKICSVAIYQNWNEQSQM